MGTSANRSLFKGDPNLPADNVSWDECQEFCRKLSAQTRETARLPTEAEWEYACRAGTTTLYSFGNSQRRLGEYAWSTENSDLKTHPVGTRKPNGWGLYDMHGNVWEWCEDVFHDGYNGAPNDGSAWVSEGGSTDYRVLRGGSWGFPWWALGSSHRYPGPATPGQDGHGAVGFRVVVSVSTPGTP
jgi:formylglycine-generating enzyme required for sulfatase activity